MGRFDGKIGFVTGGGTGIGFACARAIVDGGGRVIVAGRREHVLREACARLGPAASFAVCDVASDASVAAAFEQVARDFGALHLAVNAAGTGTVGSVLNGPVSEFVRVIETNLTGVYRVMQQEARLMAASGGGSIVNISSIAGTHTHRWMTAYCAAKAGLNMLTRCAADDLGELGIRVNAVAPGLVPTDLAAGLVANAETVAEYLRRMPLGRLGTTDDIAQAVAFLLSDESSWITGMVVAADGGHHLRQGPDLLHQLRPMFSAAGGSSTNGA
ncbi:MAG: SDR family oxidoreductase [Tepidiforma sp.]